MAPPLRRRPCCANLQLPRTRRDAWRSRIFPLTPGLELTLALFVICYLTIRGLWTFLKSFPDAKNYVKCYHIIARFVTSAWSDCGGGLQRQQPPPRSSTSCPAATPPPPPPPPPPLQGNLLIGMQAATRSRGALAPSLKGAAPRSSLSPSFSLSVLSNPPPKPHHHHSCSPSSHSCHNICSPQVSAAAGEEACDAPL